MIKSIERTRDGVGSLIDRTRDAVVGAADRTERGVESAAERVTERAHEVGEQVRQEARTASRGAHRRLDAAARAVDHGYARARGDLSRVAATVTDYATEHPGTTLIIAASAGFVLGLLARRRRLLECRG